MTQTGPKPKLTKEAVKASMTPPNRCRVRTFLDAMDQDSRTVLEDALAMTKAELPTAQVVSLLVNAGYEPDEVPSYDCILAHRARRGACRCPA